MIVSGSVIMLKCSHFITLCLVSIGKDHVIFELCHKRTVFKRIIYLFSYNFFVKFHVKKIGEPQHDHVISKSVL